MGKKRPGENVLPPDLEKIFAEEHIELIWEYLDDNFTINLKKWKEFFAIRCNMQRELPKCELFAQFGIQHLQEPMNKFLYRREGHPTWLSLIRFVVTANKKQVWEIYSKDTPKTRYKIISPK